MWVKDRDAGKGPALHSGGRASCEKRGRLVGRGRRQAGAAGVSPALPSASFTHQRSRRRPPSSPAKAEGTCLL